MRKLTLLLMSGVLAGTVSNAQVAENRSLVITPVKKSELPVGKKAETWEQRQAKYESTAKGTAPNKRTYNLVDHNFNTYPTIVDNASAPYMWFAKYAQAIYSGPVLDTVDLPTAGTVIFPQFSEWNDVNTYSGEMELTVNNAYVLDSITLYGFYGRNASKPAVVDTLIVSATYGNGGTSNISTRYYANPGDTTFFGTMYWDSTKNHAVAENWTNTNVVIKKFPLTAASVNDTNAQGWNVFKIAVGLNVPAGNMMGATFAFKTGDTYIPGDTTFAGSATPDRPFKYGMFRPRFFEIIDGAFPPYSSNVRNWNTGLTKHYVNSGSNLYNAMYGYTAAAYSLELADIDFIVSCPTCKELSPNSINDVNLVKGLKASPNPATNEIKVQFTASESGKGSLIVTNSVGQQVSAQPLNNIQANVANSVMVNTSNLPSGIYFYTVEINGSRSTDRFVVAK